MFKIMTGCIKKGTSPNEEEINKIPSYIFCRWLSSNPQAIMAANQINLFSDIPTVNQYTMIKNAFAGKIKYIPYPKNIKEDDSKKVEYLIDYFKISSEKAHEYLLYISAEELENIINMYERH